MDSFTFPHLQATAYFALFRNVENASEVRKKIVKVSTTPQGPDSSVSEENREGVNFAFIDPRLITSKTHLRTAIHQALLASSSSSTMRTHSVHSEILFYLNPTNNITESFKNFGLSDKSTSLLVVRITSPSSAPSPTTADPTLTPAQIKTRLTEIMKDTIVGSIVPLDDPERGLASVTDWGAIKKLFKLNTEPAVKAAASRSSDEEHAVVDSIVTSAVAMKNVMQ